jgi:hypothetical protein
LAEQTKSSDLKLIVYVYYTKVIADVFIPYVILLNTMHGMSKCVSDRFMAEWGELTSVVGFGSPRCVDRDGQEDQAFVIHANSFAAE